LVEEGRQRAAASEVGDAGVVWIVIGLGPLLALLLLVGLALARILGTIGRRISELYEGDEWALPPTRLSKDVEEQQAEEDETKPSQENRLSQHG
jgi:hypothetical protein